MAYPGVGDAGLSTLGGGQSAGSPRTYQVLYRNAASFCTSATFNVTNGVRVVWAP